MQFAAVLLFAGATMATYTTFETIVHTVTSCAPGYYDCPYEPHTKTSSIYVAPTYVPSASPAPYSNGTYTAPGYAGHTGAHPEPVVTVTVNACPPATTPAAVTSVVVPYPSGTGVPVAPVGTASSVHAAPAPAFTGAASSLSGSLALTAVAGLAVLILA